MGRQLDYLTGRTELGIGGFALRFPFDVVGGVALGVDFLDNLRDVTFTCEPSDGGTHGGGSVGQGEAGLVLNLTVGGLGPRETDRTTTDESHSEADSKDALLHVISFPR